MNAPLKGTGVALVTPFRDGKVDFKALGALVNHVLEGGVDFLVSLGTTGEAVTLSLEECRQVLDFTLAESGGKVPVVAGMFGGNNTEALKERIRRFDFQGISAIMSSCPAYLKPSQEGLYRHYLEIAEVSPLPIILYNVPGRTGCNLRAETTLRLARASERFIAVKEASGDLVQAMKILKDRPEGFAVLSGDDVLTLPLIAAGAEGAISVIANAFPHEFSALVRAALEGDLPRARQLNEYLLDLHPWLYVEGNPAGIKKALQLLGFCSAEVRLPLAEMSEKNAAGLAAELKKMRPRHRRPHPRSVTP